MTNERADQLHHALLAPDHFSRDDFLRQSLEFLRDDRSRVSTAHYDVILAALIDEILEMKSDLGSGGPR